MNTAFDPYASHFSLSLKTFPHVGCFTYVSNEIMGRIYRSKKREVEDNRITCCLNVRSSPEIIKVIKSRGMRWATFVARDEKFVRNFSHKM